MWVSTTIGISMYLTYKRVSIALERIMTFKGVLIVACKRIVHYSAIRMTYYLSELKHSNWLIIAT